MLGMLVCVLGMLVGVGKRWLVISCACLDVGLGTQAKPLGRRPGWVALGLFCVSMA
jgi:hypothetical protein